MNVIRVLRVVRAAIVLPVIVSTTSRRHSTGYVLC